MDSRLRRFPPDRASAIPRGQGVQTTSCFPHLAHRSAAAHKLHSPLPRGGKNNKLKAPRLHPKRAPKNQSKSRYRKAQNEHLSWLHYGRSWVAPLGRSVTAQIAGRLGSAQTAGAKRRGRWACFAQGGAAAQAQGPAVGGGAGPADAHAGLEGARDQERHRAGRAGLYVCRREGRCDLARRIPFSGRPDLRPALEPGLSSGRARWPSGAAFVRGLPGDWLLCAIWSLRFCGKVPGQVAARCGARRPVFAQNGSAASATGARLARSIAGWVQACCWSPRLSLTLINRTPPWISNPSYA